MKLTAGKENAYGRRKQNPGDREREELKIGRRRRKRP
jgi:hypothetical protein